MSPRLLLALAITLTALTSSPLQADGPPPAPTLIGPTGPGIGTMPAYTWTAAAGSEDYYLWVNNDAGVPVVQAWHGAASVCSGATCTMTPATALARGYHTFWVQARNAWGTGPWSAGMGFTVGSLPAAPSLVGPSGPGVVSTPAYTWNAVADTTDNLLWVNDSTGATAVQQWFSAASVCSGATCVATPATSLPRGHSTWWVQGKNESGTGPWSAGMSFTVGSLPAAPTLVAPTGAGVPATPTYTWNAVADTDRYSLWVNSSAAAPVVQASFDAAAACTGGTCSATPTASLAPGWHQWWVQGRNGSGDGAWSAGLGFTVGDLPGTATLVAPTGVGVATSPTFTWNAVATATIYELWVNGPTGAQAIQAEYAAMDACSAGTCAATPATTLARGAHQWWIRASNASGEGAWSAGMAFTAGDLPGAPVPRSPSGPVPTASPTYVWDALADTDDFYLWVNGSDGAPVVQLRYDAADVCTAETCSARPPAPLGSGGHTWWVQARNGSGDGPWSAGMSFTVVASGAVAAGWGSSFALTPGQALWAWGHNEYGQLGLGTTDDVVLPTQVGGVPNIVAVTSGGIHSAVLHSDGTVWTAGSNGNGGLGREGGDSPVFEPVAGLTDVVQIASGDAHVLALKADGTVAAWGWGGWGQLGNGTFASSPTPVMVSGLTSAIAIAAGGDHSLALLADGTVAAWGGNYSGQLGDGTNESRSTPVAVPGLSGIARIASGPEAYHSFAVGADGALFAWGENYAGQLGDGTTQPRSSPVLVAGITGVSHMAAGEAHSLAVRQDGSLWSWGENADGQLGLDPGSYLTPTLVASPTGVTAVAAGGTHSLALTSDGRVFSWGGNDRGQLGAGEAGAPVSTAVALSGPGFAWRAASPTINPPGGTLTDEVDATIACSTPGATIRYTTDGSEPTEASPTIESGGAVHVDGSLTIRARAWKEGAPPSSTASASFVLVTAAAVASHTSGHYGSSVQVSLTSPTPSAAIRYTTDGSDPTTASTLYESPLTLAATTTLRVRAFRGAWTPSSIVSYRYVIGAGQGDVAAGDQFSLALDPSGAVWAWGSGETGQIGDGTGTASLEPVPVEAVTDALAIAAGQAHALALRADGTVAGWGGGQLSPVGVPGLDSVVAVAAGGFHSLALRRDGQVLSWGANASGQLGDGTTDDRPLPAVVPGLANIVAVAAGEAHSLALGADGRVWAWGDNGDGQVGDGSGAPQLAPVEVMTGAISIGAGAHHSLAITSDGSGWAWGRNDRSQLSTGVDFVDNTRPALVKQGWCEPEGGPCYDSPFTDARRLAGGGVHTLALTADARLWSAGGNDDGQLGRDTYDWPNPLNVIESLASVVAFAAGGQHGLALTATREVWAWGANQSGQIGNCGSTSSTLPLKVANTGFAFLGCQPPPAPAFSVVGGTYAVAEGLAVAVSAPGEGVVIRYTTDESDPDASSPVVTSGAEIWIAEAMTLKARAWAPHGAASPVAMATYRLQAMTPVMLPPGGDFGSAQYVTISSGTLGAVVHYTSDGSTPSISSPTYPQAGISITTTTTLNAIATPQQATWLPSEVATATYQMHFGIAPAPVFSPPPGTYATPLSVSLSTTSGGTIHYTTDGSTPTLDSPPYVGPIDVANTVTLRAFVIHPDFEPGPKAFATYRLQAPQPTLTPGTGSYATPQVVVMELPGWTGSIHYTTNGADPTSADTTIISGGTILVDHSLPLKVRAFKAGWLSSHVAAANYSILVETVSVPTATPSGGSYDAPVTVSIATQTPGAVVRYALDGSEPTAASAVYSSRLVLSETTTLRARAFRGGWAPSTTLVEEYRFDAGLLAKPVLSPLPGSYATTRAVTATSATAGVTFHYTLDGTEPSDASPILGSGGQIPVDRTMRVRVRSFKAGSEPSEVTTGDYLITGAAAGGGAHSLAIRADGTLLAWGANAAGQLGLGTTASEVFPMAVPGLIQVEQIAAGDAHSLALTADGRLWAWGANDQGQLGDGTVEAKASPVQVTGGWLAPIVAIAAGAEFSLALSSDGTLWSWGANSDGQLGDGTTQSRSSPGLLTVPLGLVSIAAGGSHAVALDASGAVWAWGRNTDGQLGDGTTATALQPRLVGFASPAPTIVRIAAGQAHSMAVDDAGGLWTWGRDLWGQLGHGEAGAPRTSPLRLSETDGLLAAAGGEGHTIANAKTGEVLAWGRNDLGQLGDGSSGTVPIPQPVLGLEEIVRLATGEHHGLAIAADGALWTWGANEAGQLGDGTTTSRRLPVARSTDRLVNNEAVASDPDSDGLSTATEYRIGSDPFERDTNGDGVPDGVAVGSGTDPHLADTDGDGLSNDIERLLGTDPLRADTDGDGFADDMDLFPLDPTRWSSALPGEGDLTPPTITIWEPRHAVRLP